jgi:hypothetical protein
VESRKERNPGLYKKETVKGKNSLGFDSRISD